MPPTAPLWVMLFLLLPGCSARGQETDSLFFRRDSLRVPAVRTETSHRAGIDQRRATPEPFMQTRVHFTGDFSRRFNDLTGTANQRSLRIQALFDSEDPRISRRPAGETSAYSRLVAQFIDDVCNGPAARMLTRSNEQMYAEVSGLLTGHQQRGAIKLYLKKQQTGANRAWEIIDAETDIRLPKTDTTRSIAGQRDSTALIPPNAHELNFMGLARQIRAGCPLESFISAEAGRSQPLMELAHGLATGNLRLQALLTTTLWLNTRWGWWLQLRQFDRDTDNSGWLISDLCRTDDCTGLPAALRRFVTN